MSRIGKNIRALREAYGETQLDLAHHLGFDSPAAVSMIESGSRGQKRFDLIEKIARHYRISEGALFYQTWGENGTSFPDFLPLPFDDKKQLCDLFTCVFPILESSDAKQDAAFRRAYALHCEAAEEILESFAPPKQSFSRMSCLSLYEISLKEARLPEAAANTLWWILISGLFHCYPKVFLGLQKLERKAITKPEFFRDWYLSDCEAENIEAEKDRLRTFRKQYQKKIHELLSLLYASPSGFVHAEYYKALLWYFGLNGTGFRYGESRLIGSAMLSSLSEMGNPYAASCMEAMARFHNV